MNVRFRVWNKELNYYPTDEELWTITNLSMLFDSDGVFIDEMSNYLIEYSVGMIDSNGKYIFENDIVEESSMSYTKNELNKRYYVARFNDNTFKFELVRYYPNGEEVTCFMTEHEKYTVVGNTHEENKNERFIK